jgi:hypothetical protein
MLCARCKKVFDSEQLRPPAALLRFVALPILFLLAHFHFEIFEEGSSLYCDRCRRSLNVALFFICFLIAVFGLAATIALLIPREIRWGR